MVQIRILLLVNASWKVRGGNLDLRYQHELAAGRRPVIEKSSTTILRTTRSPRTDRGLQVWIRLKSVSLLTKRGRCAVRLYTRSGSRNTEQGAGRCQPSPPSADGEEHVRREPGAVYRCAARRLCVRRRTTEIERQFSRKRAPGSTLGRTESLFEKMSKLRVKWKPASQGTFHVLRIGQ